MLMWAVWLHFMSPFLPPSRLSNSIIYLRKTDFFTSVTGGLTDVTLPFVVPWRLTSISASALRLSNSSMKAFWRSFDWTWYSKKVNQPLMTGTSYSALWAALFFSLAAKTYDPDALSPQALKVNEPVMPLKNCELFKLPFCLYSCIARIVSYAKRDCIIGGRPFFSR